MTTETGNFAIKCDECKKEIGRTDEQRISSAGGQCADCHRAIVAQLRRAGLA